MITDAIEQEVKIMSKDEWKSTGKQLGGAFKGLAKSLIRTASDGVSAAKQWAISDEEHEAEAVSESSAFNDGTWRETGKNLGQA